MTPAVALVAPTIERPLAVQRLVRTAELHLPGIRIYVGDQSRPDPFMDAFYREHGVTVVRLPYDCGVSEARNRTVERVEEEFFLLCDDDFAFTPTTRLDDALAILKAAPDVGVVGGRLFDAFTGGEEIRRRERLYEMYFTYNQGNRTLVSFPIHLFAPDPVVIAGITCYPCDALLNFAVFRRAMVGGPVRWDPLFKSDGEHEDFYLNLKVNSPWRVVYLPTLLAEHERPETVGYQRRRQRTGGWSLMMEKWNIDQYLEFGAGLRTIADVGAFYPELGLSRPRFFASRRLSYDGVVPPTGDAFEVTAEGLRPLQGDRPPVPSRHAPAEIAPAGALNFVAASHTMSPPRYVAPPLVVTTIDRPEAIQRFVRTARAVFPGVRIYVGDQSRPDPFMDAFYRAQGIDLARLPHDAGLSATRNALVKRVEEDVFVLCDDDFVFTAETDFAPALEVLRTRPEIGVIGGRVLDVIPDTHAPEPIDWAMWIMIEERARLLAFVPIHLLAPQPLIAGGVTVHPCDAVLNFAVFRRAIFGTVVRWDPAFRGDGEHEDFYVNLKLNADVGIAHLPSLTVLHARPDTVAYERRRLRTDGWARLMEKWGFRQYLEFGTGLRSLAALERIQRQRTLRRDRFYRNGSLRFDGDAEPPAGAFEVAGRDLLPLHAYDSGGDAVFDREFRLLRADVRFGVVDPMAPA